jgi:D-glycero-D-manno-heptose 1,7-bisphosphate phosphatase
VRAFVTGRIAAFLDRDGTIIRDTNFVRDPDDVELLPGAAAAIRTLNERKVPVIVVTNQSGIARGLLTEQDYERVRMRFDALLAAEGARVEATYHCPHYPEISGPCECRKPAPKLYRQAAAEHQIDLTRSFYVGDRMSDAEPPKFVGGHGIFINCDSTPARDRLPQDQTTTVVTFDDGERTIPVVHSLPEAVELILDQLPRR